MSHLTPHAIVIGSGPGGVSCARSLLTAGWRVTMLDVGFQLERVWTDRLVKLQAVDAAGWNRAEEAGFLRSGITADAKGIPLKLAYGSDFPYRTVNGGTRISCDGAHTGASHARGGFSNVWGSAMLPYRQQDLANWPITEADLAPHYRAVLRHVPLAGREDDLANLFPLYGEAASLPVSGQARALLDRMHGNRALHSRNIFTGSSRLAVRNSGMAPCRACGLCMYGCPANLVYCSASSLDELGTDTKFTYRPSVYVTRVSESNGFARAIGFEASAGNKFELSADRLFIACGTTGTTAILLRSLDAYNTPVTMLDSHYFLQPAITLRGVSSVTKENLHTLAQAFIEIMDDNVSSYTVHFQVYTYNELYAQAIAAATGRLDRFVPKDFLLSRLLVLQGYLHSDESPSMTCALERSEPGDTLRISVNENPAARRTMRRAAGKLLGASTISGLIPLLPLLKPGQPGRGYHSGGTFPMTTNPGRFQSDILGRPAGFQRIHAVDSTVFPSIPATTITLSTMANAHRIGALSAEL